MSAPSCAAERETGKVPGPAPVDTAVKSPAPVSKGFDHSLWDAFLKKYVNEKGDVNYAAVKKDPSMLLDYLEILAASNAPKQREEGIAFWMNAYNAGTIKLILEHYPVQNIQQIPSFWDIAAIQTLENSIQPGKTVTSKNSLNDIRLNKLIGTYRDEKIHLALSCGARGCPPLQQQAFTGENVEGRLFLATRAFVNDPKQAEVIPEKKKIRLSKLFKWYERDFDLDFGTPEKIGKFTSDETAVLSFLAYYLENEEQIAYLEEGRYKIDYFPFDWTLNDWKNTSSGAATLSAVRETSLQTLPSAASSENA